MERELELESFKEMVAPVEEVKGQGKEGKGTSSTSHLEHPPC